MDCRKTMNPIENKLNFYAPSSPLTLPSSFFFTSFEALKFQKKKSKSDDGLEKKTIIGTIKMPSAFNGDKNGLEMTFFVIINQLEQ
jgi:hypothetical protein